mmetsp:Transcript_22709/g.33898  ORF Transcript_22709/g.33898 Transcript_22709/m.33898 type:complete len:193 (+) Transcript_22709:57-635(+)
MTLRRWLLFVITLLTCRVEALDDREPIIQSRHLRQEAASAYLHSLETNLEQPYQADTAPLLDEQHMQSIERRSDVHAPSTPSRLLQQSYWRTNNNNNRNSGINSDGTTGEYYWKDRINKGLRNVGIVLIIWFVVVGTIGTICRCYLCWESILGNSFRYNSNFNEDGNHVEDSDERLDGVDMPPISSLNGHQV